MERLNFVDTNLQQLSENTDKAPRYAVDLGVCAYFGGYELIGEDHHCFVSAAPWISEVNKKEALAFMHKLEELNPGAKFNLLELEQIFELNKLGKEQEFQILNCWTRSTYDDWHGRVDGYYSLKDGRQVIDRGKNITDVYFVFGFFPGQERPILLP